MYKYTKGLFIALVSSSQLLANVYIYNAYRYSAWIQALTVIGVVLLYCVVLFGLYERNESRPVPESDKKLPINDDLYEGVPSWAIKDYKNGECIPNWVMERMEANRKRRQRKKGREND